jgi:aminoglycoside phosphotransferase (APT) family kinase protein
MREPEHNDLGVDLDLLSSWMDEQNLAPGKIENAEALGGGTQNIILRFDRGGVGYVLRHPPPHKRKNSDETMRREARVLAAIADSDVPHPGLIAACPDESVLGSAFYLMEPVDGFNATTGLPELHANDPTIRHGMGLSMVDAIAALGRIDYVEVGLADFGKPDGYLERQVARWRAQLDGYSELEGYPGPEIPHVDSVAGWLDTNRPTHFEPGIIHGDFHLANVMFRFDGPELAAAVDWELSTIGDPLLDLGWLLATWPEPGGGGVGSVGLQAWDSFPIAEELVDRYAEQSTRDLSCMAWYEVLACYKLGIILEGTHARAYSGKAPKTVGDALHATTIGLFERGHRRILAAESPT